MCACTELAELTASKKKSTYFDIWKALPNERQVIIGVFFCLRIESVASRAYLCRGPVLSGAALMCSPKTFGSSEGRGERTMQRNGSQMESLDERKWPGCRCAAKSIELREMTAFAAMHNCRRRDCVRNCHTCAVPLPVSLRRRLANGLTSRTARQ